MEIHAGRPACEQPCRDQQRVQSHSHPVGHRPRPGSHTEGVPELVSEEQHPQREQENVPRDVVSTHQPRSAPPVGGHLIQTGLGTLQQRLSEQRWMRPGRDRRPHLAILRGDVEYAAVWQRQHALAARRDEHTIHDRWAEEPRREREPRGRRCDPLCPACVCAGGGRARGPEEEMCGGCPGPGPFDEVDVENIGFRGKVVGAVEWVGQVGNERVRSVEIGAVDGRIDGPDEDEGGEGDKGG